MFICLSLSPLNLTAFFFHRVDIRDILNHYKIQLPDKVLEIFEVVESCSMDCIHNLLKMDKEENMKCLLVVSHLALNEYHQVLTDLKYFLSPLLEYRALWIHIDQFHLLRQYVDSFLPGSDSTSSMQAFALALNKSRILLVKMIKGEDTTYRELTLNESIFPLKSKDDIDKELRTLSYLIKLSVTDDKFDKNVTTLMDMFSLLECADHVSNVSQVLSQFELQGCLKDETTVQLNTILEHCITDERHKLTPPVASGYLKTVKSALMLHDSSDHMDLFEEIKNCDVFHKFITDQFFPTGQEDINQGKNSFQEWYGIISNQLQNVEFEEQVFHQLSLAFQYILPFVDKKQNLRQLMNAVIDLNSTNGFQELRTVSANMHHIERWSAQAEVG